MLASWLGAKNRQLAKALFGPFEESGTSRGSCVVIWLSADQAATHERFVRRDCRSDGAPSPTTCAIANSG
jgi:hypothetical protein